MNNLLRERNEVIKQTAESTEWQRYLTGAETTASSESASPAAIEGTA
jgi:hypothetical protein